MPQLTAVDVTAVTLIEKKLSALKISAAGTVPAASRLSAVKVTAAGTVAVVVTPPAAQTVEPLSVVTLTASLQNGLTADSWTWRQISGQAVGIQGTGATVTLTAPPNMSGATIVVGVKATVGSFTSTEKTVTVQVYPQIYWRLDAGGTWQTNLPVTTL